MKWKDLTFKEKYQIYSNLKSNNPNVNFFDIEEVFDSIPAYEDGGIDKNMPVLPKELGLTPGTPEYLERQKRISGSANVVQPEAYVTPAGYIKDAMNFVEDLREGDYINAGIDAALNLIPWGVGKTLKKVKNRITKTNNVGQELNSYGEFNPTPTVTKKGRKSKVNKPTEEAEASEATRLSNNRRKYESEISKTIENAVFPDNETYNLLDYIDNVYGTNYKNAYSNIAMRDMTNRGKYLSWGTNAKDSYGTVRLKSDADGNTSKSIQDYLMILNPDTYMTGTANHELGHIADGLAGSKQFVQDGNIYTTNKYLNYLANESGAMSEGQLRKLGLHGAASNRNYLLNPTEAKSHMLTLKRALKESGEINNWSSPVTEDMLFRYFNSGNFNKMVKYQYDLYNNKQDYIERLNKLIPMEILMPVGGIGLMNYESNQNKK